MTRTPMEKRVNVLLFVAVFLTLGLLLVVSLRSRVEERRWHFAHARGATTVIADITVNLNGRPHEEHCQTCHPGGRAVTTGQRPGIAATHPDIGRHSIYDLGCTGCHLGEGMAADVEISHGRIGNGVRRVLAGEEMQATCYVCHELKPLKGAEGAWRGSVLFAETACATCHTTGEFNGASYGPDLSDAGSFLSLERIRRVIEDPKEGLPSSIMPKFSLSPDDIREVSYFLKSRVPNPYYETPMRRTARQREEERLEGEVSPERIPPGIDLLKQKRCLACHKFGETDGQVGPDLTHMGYMRPPE